MTILPHAGGIAATNCYLVADESIGHAVLFDAPNDTVEPLMLEAKRRNWEVIGLWLTHGHFDHIADHSVVSQHYPGARVLIHRLDDAKLMRPNSMAMFLPFKIAPRKADGYIEDGHKLNIGSIEFEVIHTPGHAPGHVMFHAKREKVLIGGDLIIMGAVGRTDFPDSDPAALNQSIRRVMKLPPDTRLLPGHGPSSTLAEEKSANPYVREALAGSR